MTKGILSFCMDPALVRRLLEVVGGDLRPGEYRSTWLYRVADDVGVSYRIIKAVWWGERLTPEIAMKIKQAIKRNEQINRRIAERLERSAAILREMDEEFYRDEIAKYWGLARRVRDFDGGEK